MARLGLKLGELWRRIVFLRRGRQFDAEIEEELRFHAAMKADAYRADGAGAQEARYAAMRRLGNPTELKERSRDMWGWGGWKRSRKTPGTPFACCARVRRSRSSRSCRWRWDRREHGGVQRAQRPGAESAAYRRRRARLLRQ